MSTSTEKTPEVGSRWCHKKTKRVAVVVHTWESLVEFRYTTPVKGRGRGLMRARTNTTPQNKASFLKAFEEILPEPVIDFPGTVAKLQRRVLALEGAINAVRAKCNENLSRRIDPSDILTIIKRHVPEPPLMKPHHEWLKTIKAPKCAAGCGYPVANAGDVCGECSCEDDCAP